MRILYISHLHPPKDALLKNIGGMQRVSMQLLDELRSREDIHVDTVIQHAQWKWIGIRTTFFFFLHIVRLPLLVRKYKPDVILFSSMVTGGLTYYTRKFINVPMVTINHGQDVKMQFGYYQKRIDRLFEYLDGVISVSRATREECIKRGMQPDKGVALPNGFDMSDFNEVPDKQEARQEIEKQLSVDLTGKHLLLTVGRQVKRKGHEWFIKEVLQKISSDVVYLVIGDGPEHENLQHLRSQHPQADQIILAGKQPDDLLKKAYSAADLFIMPNIPIPDDMEGFGIVMLEANLAATPAIASDLEGIKDVIKDGMNGYKIPVYEAGIFAQKVDEVLKNEYQVLGERSRKYVKENFTWNKVADRYISYLYEVIEKYKSSHQ